MPVKKNRTYNKPEFEKIRTLSKQRLKRKIDRISTEEAAQLRRLITEMYGE
jgi:mRNA interferase MazF